MSAKAGSSDGTTWTTIDERGTTLAEIELLGTPAPACTTTISDKVAGAVSIRSGVTCLKAGAQITGLVSVSRGASPNVSCTRLGRCAGL